MTPIKFDGFNCIYKGAPGVEDLPAKREDGNVISRWWPSQKEIDVLVRGGSVELVIAGGQPPVELRVV
jgi:hypothetical protein